MNVYSLNDIGIQTDLDLYPLPKKNIKPEVTIESGIVPEHLPLPIATTASYEITTMFHGFDDIYVEANAFSIGGINYTRILSEGGRVMVYGDYSQNYDPTNPLGPGPVAGVAPVHGGPSPLGSPGCGPGGRGAGRGRGPAHAG